MTIKEILMKRDGLSEHEAQSLIDKAKDALHNYINGGDLMGAEEVCKEFFGLEPDYIFELL